MSTENKERLLKFASFVIMFLVVCPFIGFISVTDLYEEPYKRLFTIMAFVLIAISGPGSFVLLKHLFISEQNRRER